MTTRRAVYAGSFDPPTNGHLWIVEQGAKLFDELVVVVAQNPLKPVRTPIEVREGLVRACCAHLANVEVRTDEGHYLVHVAAKMGAGYLLRGLRNPSDFAYEQTLRNLNRDLDSGVETVMLVTPRELAEVSSSTVRALVGFAGWQELVARFVPPPVMGYLMEARS